MKKIEFWRWEGWGQDPHTDQNGATLESRDAKMHLEMIGGGW